MQKALDELARFNLPIKITEFDCRANDEAVQAQTLEDVYRIAFAHSAVQGILMWGFWEKAHDQPNAAILRADFSKKPSAEAYERLVFSNWWTRTEGNTDYHGDFTCRAFFGDFNVRVKTKGGPDLVEKVSLKKAAGNALVKIRLPPEPDKTEPKESTERVKKPSDDDPFHYDISVMR